jgi:hypothetical protein
VPQGVKCNSRFYIGSAAGGGDRSMLNVITPRIAILSRKDNLIPRSACGPLPKRSLPFDGQRHTARSIALRFGNQNGPLRVAAEAKF